MMTKNTISLKGNTDGRGLLVSLESKKNVPFDIKRVYFLTHLKSDHPRGFHAHKKLKQLMVCVSGSCDLILDDGKSRETFKLDSPTQGVLVENFIWREMHNFSENCVLMVLADEYYDENDYIRDYEQFKRLSNDSPS